MTMENLPDEKELTVLCCCDHMLVNHSYEDEHSVCDRCSCAKFHIPEECSVSYHCPNYSKEVTGEIPI